MIPVCEGLHQLSSLSPYIFAMIMDVLARGIKDISPWCMLYAKYIVLCGTRSEVVEKKLEEWRRAMEDRGLKINSKKTVYLRFNVDGNLDGNSDINLQGQNLARVNTFKKWVGGWVGGRASERACERASEWDKSDRSQVYGEQPMHIIFRFRHSSFLIRRHKVTQNVVTIYNTWIILQVFLSDS